MLFFLDFAQFRHGQRIPARRIQSYLKLSTTRCKLIELSQLTQAQPFQLFIQLTSVDPEETLKSLKLYPQETLMLEER